MCSLLCFSDPLHPPAGYQSRGTEDDSLSVRVERITNCLVSQIALVINGESFFSIGIGGVRGIFYRIVGVGRLMTKNKIEVISVI